MDITITINNPEFNKKQSVHINAPDTREFAIIVGYDGNTPILKWKDLPAKKQDDNNDNTPIIT